MHCAETRNKSLKRMNFYQLNYPMTSSVIETEELAEIKDDILKSIACKNKSKV